MHPMQPAPNALEDAAAMRRADRELLSLALMHARNRTLAWLSLLDGVSAACWLAGRTAWWQERWIARNVQRSRGPAADPTRAPLASIEPQADSWWDRAGHDANDDAGAAPDVLRAYLAETLDVTLDLLAATDDSDDALHWYRASLFEEDAAVQRLAALAQRQRIDVRRLLPERVLRPVRAPLWFAAQRWQLGSSRGGFVPAAEQWAHDEPVPEFEIDAQAVTWQQFAEFALDGGYDDVRWWSEDGARWLQADARRTPRDVEQLRHGVLLQRFGQLVRAPAGEAASMLGWYEARRHGAPGPGGGCRRKWSGNLPRAAAPRVA
jgi:gamma-glutamyl hercynylcysteine S-oxide synthase